MLKSSPSARSSHMLSTVVGACVLPASTVLSVFAMPTDVGLTKRWKGVVPLPKLLTEVAMAAVHMPHVFAQPRRTSAEDAQEACRVAQCVAKSAHSQRPQVRLHFCLITAYSGRWQYRRSSGQRALEPLLSRTPSESSSHNNAPALLAEPELLAAAVLLAVVLLELMHAPQVLLQLCRTRAWDLQ